MADIKIAGRIKAGAADGISGYASEILFDDEASDKTVKEKLEGKQDTLTFDNVPTKGSNNPVKSGGVYQAIQDIDVSSQISGKADKSEMSVVAGTGTDADKTTITLKNGTSATVLTQHQDVSEFLKEGEVFGEGDDSTASFNSYSDTVWNKQQTLSESQKQQIRDNIGVGAADNEDIQNVSGELKFADKAYNTSSHSGLGRKYLRKNIVDGKNVLTQAMVNSANTIYHIQYDYDLNGQTITLPAGCVLEFDGGSVKNGTIVGNGTAIKTELVRIFGENLTINGSWNVSEAYSEWFGAVGDGANDDTNAVNACVIAFNRCNFSAHSYLITDTITTFANTVINGVSRNRTTLVYRGTESLFNISTQVEICDVKVYVPYPTDDSIICLAPIFNLTNCGHSLFRNIEVNYPSITRIKYGEVKGTTAIKLYADSGETGFAWVLFDNLYVWEADKAIEITTTNAGWVSSNSFVNSVASGCEQVLYIRNNGNSSSQIVDNIFDIRVQNEVRAQLPLYDIHSSSNSTISANKITGHIWDVLDSQKANGRLGFTNNPSYNYSVYSEVNSLVCLGRISLYNNAFPCVRLTCYRYSSSEWFTVVIGRKAGDTNFIIREVFSLKSLNLRFYYQIIDNVLYLYSREDYAGPIFVHASSYAFTATIRTVPVSQIDDSFTELSVTTEKLARYPIKFGGNSEYLQIGDNFTLSSIQTVANLRGWRLFSAQSAYIGDLSLRTPTVGCAIVHSTGAFGTSSNNNKDSVCYYIDTLGDVYKNIYNGDNDGTWAGWRKVNPRIITSATQLPNGISAGELAIVTGTKQILQWDGTAWRNYDGSVFNAKRSGTKAQRPTGTQIMVGFQYMQVDTAYGTFPIWASAINGDDVTWVKADGNLAYRYQKEVSDFRNGMATNVLVGVGGTVYQPSSNPTSTISNPSTIDYQEVNLRAGDILVVRGICYGYTRLWALVDSSRKLISLCEQSSATSSVPDQVQVVATADCTAIIQCKNSTASPAYGNTSEVPYMATVYSDTAFD